MQARKRWSDQRGKAGWRGTDYKMPGFNRSKVAEVTRRVAEFRLDGSRVFSQRESEAGRHDTASFSSQQFNVEAVFKLLD